MNKKVFLILFLLSQAAHFYAGSVASAIPFVTSLPMPNRNMFVREALATIPVLVVVYIFKNKSGCEESRSEVIQERFLGNDSEKKSV